MRWPQGIRSSGVACGIKGSDIPDLGLIVGEHDLTWAGTFTENPAAAAPVHWSRAHLGGTVRALVVNSGNANACTGERGREALERTVSAVAEAIACDVREVLVASTGVIGVPLPVEFIETGLPVAAVSLTDEVDPFARSILTTDTCTKTVELNKRGATFVGVAKGAAMLAPNMATMLSFIATDADVSAEAMRDALGVAVRRSFNRISVDACESTNDSVFLLSTRRGPAIDHDALVGSLTSVCCDLAEKMVRDAEGGTRFVRITVDGARDEEHAADLGRAIAASALWRAAVHGADPNWGRIASALGQADRSLDPSRLEIAIGPEILFDRGEPSGSTEAAAKAMDGAEFEVTCRVGDGPGSAEVLTCDLSPAYVVENAWGTT